jgi:hypothetical protein
LQYYEARLNDYYETFAIRNYICDSLYVSGQNKAFNKRLIDILNDVRQPQEPERAPEEIVEDIMTRMGLKFE